MKEEEKNKNKDCPLCQVSQESIDRLKEEKPIKKKRGFWGKILALILILILVGFVLYKFFPTTEVIPKEVNLQVGSLAPDFVLEDINGNKVTLADFRDKKPVLLVFWATWCGACAKELPDLKIFTETNRNEVEVLVVSSGENRETIRNYIQEKDINFTMLLDEKRDIWSKYLVRGTPSHFLINSKGEIIATRPGLALKDNLEVMLSMLTELW